VWIQELSQQFVNGLALGAIYALIAIGYTLIFGVLRLVFFAQGDLGMVAAFSALLSMRWLQAQGLPAGLAVAAGIVTAAVVTVLVSLASERIALRPLRQAPRTKQLISTLGIVLVLQNTVFFAISSENLAFPVALAGSGWTPGGIVVSPVQVLIPVIALLVMIGTYGIIEHTRLGLKIRAISDNPTAAARLGINRTSVARTTFALSGLIATVAGLMMALYDGVVRFDMGFLPGIKGFTAAILGGLGSIPGAALGGVLIGIIEAIGAGYISSEYRHVFVYLVLILVLLFRRNGLFRSAQFQSA
jgi:branched-chain amino acid transport system permease protein